MERLRNLDYLRGLAASGIMLYHFLTFTFGGFTAGDLMGRVSIYGVAVFYVLSGLTLFLVYSERMKPSRRDVQEFLRKRFFRIFPLFWLATIVSVPLFVPEVTWYRLLFNLTGIFGLISWSSPVAIGGWSIGNELVFYLFFIVFIFLLKRSKLLFIILSIFLCACFLYFAFIRIDPGATLHAFRTDYVNPLNQVFLFLGGFLIGYLFRKRHLSPVLCYTLLFASLFTFIFYPVEGDTILLITGFNRIIFSVACFAICLAFFKMEFRLPRLPDRALRKLGEMSYSVYLLHPIVYALVGILLKTAAGWGYHSPESVRFFLAVVVTYCLSYVVYKYVEMYFMKMGHRSSSADLPAHST